MKYHDQHPITSNQKPTTRAVAPLIAIVGQTASGKSDIAMRAAVELGGEIIAADSWTVRRELDVATAKPSAQDRARVKHHLIDIVDPCADFTAVLYQRKARQAIADICERGKVPMLVGGTGLYVDSVLHNYSFSPAASAQQRTQYNNMSLDNLLAEAKRRQLDTSGIDTRNKRRIMRLLETSGHEPSQQSLRPNTLVVGLSIDKELLHERIEQRVDAMFDQGLEQEVARLAEKNSWNCEGLKGIGYREWEDYFAGTQSLEQTRQRIIQATKQLAKRQHTWFKRSSDIVWCDNNEIAIQQMYAFLFRK